MQYFAFLYFPKPHIHYDFITLAKYNLLANHTIP